MQHSASLEERRVAVPCSKSRCHVVDLGSRLLGLKQEIVLAIWFSRVDADRQNGFRSFGAGTDKFVLLNRCNTSPNLN